MIHIKRTLAIGDVIWTEPIIRYFLEKREVVRVVTKFPAIFENYPSKNLILNEEMDLSQIEKFYSSLKSGSQVIDLDGAYEEHPKMRIIEAYRLKAGIPEMELSKPRLFLSDEEKKAHFENYIVLHLEKSPFNFRNVYGVDWKTVVSFLEEKKFKVLQLSRSGQNIYGTWIPTKTLRDMISLIYHAKAFIGLDSGPSHIAAAFDKPSILFFGAVNPSLRHIKTFNGFFLQGFCEYAHCYQDGSICRLVGDQGVPKCSVHTTENVIQKIQELLNV